jgi:hypothetical protein
MRVMRCFRLVPTLLLLVSCGKAQRPPVDAAGGADVAVSDAGGEARDAGDAGAAGDAGGDGDGDAPITEDEFCGLKAEQECQVVPRCVTVTMSACVAQRQSLCLDAGARAASGTRRFRPENVGACVERTAAAYAKAVITPADLAAVDDVCAHVYQGDVGLLGACSIKYECSSATAICDKGVCSERVIKPAGASCGNPGEICATGAYCAQTTAGLLSCLDKGGIGASCAATTPCLESLRCVAGTCADRQGAAQSCLANDDCAASAPFCDPFAGNRCDAGLMFAAGAPSCAAYGGGAGNDAGSPG